MRTVCSILKRAMAPAQTPVLHQHVSKHERNILPSHSRIVWSSIDVLTGRGFAQDDVREALKVKIRIFVYL